MSEFNLSENAIKQFKDLYSFQDETIESTFRRVAKEFVTNDEDEDIAYNLLADGIWRPNTPVFLNAGTDHKIFSACFTVNLRDSMESIYDVANVSRKIFQFGSGVGIPIGNLREKNAYIYEGDTSKVPEGKSSGPITFMKLYDAVGETTKSGGRVRRAAILCSMPIWHPDIMEFISCKSVDGRLANMNISVCVTDGFMKALEDKVPYPLHSPSDGTVVGEIDPVELWDKLSEMSHKTADPGIIFIDEVNKWNTLIAKHLVETTNPCGEQPLIGFMSCNLSAINIYKFIDGISNGDVSFDFDSLYQTTYKIMGFMDNIIDTMEFPDERYKINTTYYRPVGIGIMGLADAMFMLGYRYDGPEGRKFASDVMKTITTACVEWSADAKGTFADGSIKGMPIYEDFKKDTESIISEHIDHNEKIMEKVRNNGLRNCQFTTCQPTGTTALSCDASYGMEPCFGLVFQKNYIDGTSVIIPNKVFEYRFKNESWYTDDLIERIFRNGGTLKNLRGIPKEVREVFVTAHDIKYKDRIDMQSELQKYCSTAISSTVNMSNDVKKEEIADLYKYAYEKKLKGITIYRDGSKKNQPVTFNEDKKDTPFKRPSRLSSNTHIVETGNGKMYVTVCDYKGRPLELFIAIGKSGTIINTFSEAVGRLISIMLQNSIPIEEITKTLIGINSDRSVWSRFEETDKKPSQILSIPDGIAQLLNRYYSGLKYNGELDGESCLKCGQPMIEIEGCLSCTCGFSECG